MINLKTNEFIRQFVGDTGKIFNITFIKKDGTTRSFNARFGVAKNLAGGGLAYSPEKHNLLKVFSMDDDGYRMVNLSNILRIKANGVTIKFN
jgi:hypothetical protein